MACNSNVECLSCITFFWNIEDFNYHWPEGKLICSPIFIFEVERKNWEWSFIFHSRGEIDEDILVEIYGKCYDGHENIETKMELAFLANNGSVLQTKPVGRSIYRTADNWINYDFVICYEVMKGKRKTFMSQDTLKIRSRLWKNGGNTLKPSTFFARSVLRKTKIDIFCDIKKFSSLESRHYFVYAIYWKSSKKNVILYIAGIEDKIIMRIVSCYVNLDFLMFQSFVKDTNGQMIDCGKREVLGEELQRNVLHTLPFTKKYFLDNKNKYLKNDVLSLVFQCTWSKGFIADVIKGVYFGSNHIENEPFLLNREKEQFHEDDLKEILNTCILKVLLVM
ncbi:speckle-type POZ protein B [Trichonephila clavata]|uniref:Speckle-type POZ protein B n=1 Tax=Trichonephila clavata TaxID=2740835 RepID=A0A8X6J9Z3_TRICU|nr:speckle-type POZ protein B [Trichonephila clavata]